MGRFRAFSFPPRFSSTRTTPFAAAHVATPDAGADNAAAPPRRKAHHRKALSVSKADPLLV